MLGDDTLDMAGADIASKRIQCAYRMTFDLMIRTNNHVAHRFAVFASSNLALLAMIVHLGAGII